MKGWIIGAIAILSDIVIPLAAAEARDFATGALSRWSIATTAWQYLPGPIAS